MCLLCSHDHIARQIAQNEHLELAKHFQALADLYTALGNGKLEPKDIHGSGNYSVHPSILHCMKVIPVVVRELTEYR